MQLSNKCNLCFRLLFLDNFIFTRISVRIILASSFSANETAYFHFVAMNVSQWMQVVDNVFEMGTEKVL